MIWIILEIAWAGLVNDSDVLLTAQGSMVSEGPVKSWMQLMVQCRISINYCAPYLRTVDTDYHLQDITIFLYSFFILTRSKGRGILRSILHTHLYYTLTIPSRGYLIINDGVTAYIARIMSCFSW